MSFLRSPLAPRHLRAPPTSRPRPTATSLPEDVLVLIITQGHSSPAFLAKLALLSSSIYRTTIPYLYRSVTIDRQRIDRFLWGVQMAERPKTGPGSFTFVRPSDAPPEGKEKKEIVVTAATDERKRSALSFVKTITFEGLPLIGSDASTLEEVVAPPARHGEVASRGTPFTGLKRIIISAEMLFSLVRWKQGGFGKDHPFVGILRQIPPSPGTTSHPPTGSPSPGHSVDPADEEAYPYFSGPSSSSGITLELTGSLASAIAVTHRMQNPPTTSPPPPPSIPAEIYPIAEQTLTSLCKALRVHTLVWHSLTSEQLLYLEGVRQVWHFVPTRVAFSVRFNDEQWPYEKVTVLQRGFQILKGMSKTGEGEWVVVGGGAGLEDAVEDVGDMLVQAVVEADGVDECRLEHRRWARRGVENGVVCGECGYP
ncbi:hypothetical protein IAT38_000479 [Cryptococcus sp. DSM 104549]